MVTDTGICQVNLANQNTRIVEVLDKAALVNTSKYTRTIHRVACDVKTVSDRLLVNIAVEAEAAPVEEEDDTSTYATPRSLPTTAAVYRWPTSKRVLIADRQPNHYFHVNPTNNRREPFSPEDNNTIFGAQNSGSAMASAQAICRCL